jgi:hypothetical protein
VEGEQSWRRCQRVAGALLTWQIVHREGAAARDRERSPAEQDVLWLVALALWRASAALGGSVDELPVSAPLAWLGGPAADRLWARPLPDVLAPAWSRVRERSGPLIRVARRVFQVSGEGAVRRAQALGETPDGGPAPEATIGAWVAAVLTGLHPPAARTPEGWALLARDVTVLGERGWTPGDEERAAARQLLPSLVAAPDRPTVPSAVDQPAWLQRLAWLVDLAATIDTVLDVTGLSGGPFVELLALAARLGSSLAPEAAELEASWAGWGRRLSGWERAHFPLRLREEVLAAERAFGRLRELLSALGF